MKRGILSLSTFVIVVGFAGSVYAAPTVVNSKHNLGSEGTRNANYATTGTAEVCVFCHTPHGSNTSVNAPLWNKKVNAGSSYSAYYSPTIDTGTSGLVGNPDGVSLACLSCHDGTLGMDTFINAPGSGNYVEAGSDWSYDWSTGAGTGGTIGTRVTNLSSDLRNDHPISMRYAYYSSDPKYNVVQPSVGNSSIRVVGINRGNYGRSGDADLVVSDGDIRLFNTNADGAGSNYKVQCASCHNPHGTDNGGASGISINDGNQTGAYPTFLQRPNNSSNLCITCHIK